MKAQKKNPTDRKSRLSIEDILQRASLSFTPDDFITVKEDSDKKLYTENIIE